MPLGKELESSISFEQGRKKAGFLFILPEKGGVIREKKSILAKCRVYPFLLKGRKREAAFQTGRRETLVTAGEGPFIPTNAEPARCNMRRKGKKRDMERAAERDVHCACASSRKGPRRRGKRGGTRGEQ